MERKHNVNISIDCELAHEKHYNGVLKEETLSDILEALNKLSEIQYHIKGKNISITSK
ncbi:DUF4974 domain-containing protein [Parabacteroides sp. OttesenSCG-928-O15]|nr:DUF4974 domain-containing protein [Parabacteroides sp. OttesenSCG-928-O15]